MENLCDGLLMGAGALMFALALGFLLYLDQSFQRSLEYVYQRQNQEHVVMEQGL